MPVCNVIYSSQVGGEGKRDEAGEGEDEEECYLRDPTLIIKIHAECAVTFRFIFIDFQLAPLSRPILAFSPTLSLSLSLTLACCLTLPL